MKVPTLINFFVVSSLPLPISVLDFTEIKIFLKLKCLLTIKKLYFNKIKTLPETFYLLEHLNNLRFFGKSCQFPGRLKERRKWVGGENK